MEWLRSIISGNNQELFELTGDSRQDELIEVRRTIGKLSKVPENNRNDAWEQEIREVYTYYVHLRSGTPMGNEIEIIQGPIFIPITKGRSIYLPANPDYQGITE